MHPPSILDFLNIFSNSGRFQTCIRCLLQHKACIDGLKSGFEKNYNWAARGKRTIRPVIQNAKQIKWAGDEEQVKPELQKKKSTQVTKKPVIGRDGGLRQPDLATARTWWVGKGLEK